jgi:hypothetical protein
MLASPEHAQTQPRLVKSCKRGHAPSRDAKNYCRECGRLASQRRRDADPSYHKRLRLADPKKNMLEGAAKRARADGYPCTLTAEDIAIPEFCPLLGIRLERGVGKLSPASPSLDKIKPELGYVPGNVWVISFRANAIKRDATVQELQMLVAKLTEKLR